MHAHIAGHDEEEQCKCAEDGEDDTKIERLGPGEGIVLAHRRRSGAEVVGVDLFGGGNGQAVHPAVEVANDQQAAIGDLVSARVEHGGRSRIKGPYGGW